MKKGTKMITTAVAFALVVATMVVGIYAATSASVGISATINWTAEAGLQFRLVGGVAFSKAHYIANGNKFPEISDSSELTRFETQQTFETITVDTKTTNTQATSMSRTLNAEFYDDTDDGVNNPRDLWYWYYFWNDTFDSEQNRAEVPFKVTITKIPQTTSNIKVQYAFSVANGSFGYELHSSRFSDTVPTEMPEQDYFIPSMIVIKLTLITPDQSLSNFDAGISFNITKL